MVLAWHDLAEEWWEHADGRVMAQSRASDGVPSIPQTTAEELGHALDISWSIVGLDKER